LILKKMFSGSNFGTIITMSLSGFLASSSYGWPSIFYTDGSVSIVYGIVWFWFGAESPAVHKGISEEERDYIQESLGQKEKNKVRLAKYYRFSSIIMWN